LSVLTLLTGGFGFKLIIVLTGVCISPVNIKAVGFPEKDATIVLNIIAYVLGSAKRYLNIRMEPD
jgi:hypothetical protein